MKLLFDENLAPGLVASLADSYPESSHVQLLGLGQAEDRMIWEYARDDGFVIVSKDADFQQMSFRFGQPPKVIWLKVGNGPTSEILHLLSTGKSTVSRFVDDPDAAMLILA